MIKKTVFAVFACFSLSALVSCTSNLSETPTMSKTRAMSIAAGGSSASSFLPLPASSSTVAKASKLSKDKHGMPTYHNHSDRTRYVRTTAFSHMENEPGAPGRMNASGGILKYGSVRSAAADWSVYPLGTMFRVKGQPHTYVVDDYGSALAGTNTIDIFKPCLNTMRQWGTRETEITVIQWGSYERSVRLLKGRVRHDHCRHMYHGCMKKLSCRVASKDIASNGAL